MYWLRKFIFKLKRGLSWFAFSFKQNAWQEDYELFQTIEKVLLDTANYFESRERKGYAVSVDNTEDIADMRLAAKLIRMKINDHYWDLYTESQRNPNYKSTGKIDDLFKEGEGSFYKPTYRLEDAILAEQKDDRALQIAMKIIAEKGFHWWV